MKRVILNDCINLKKIPDPRQIAAGKTLKSILISCGARLAPFDIAELRELTSYDEMELDMVGDRLPYHVRFLLDEFANIGQIPKFDKLIATIRSREISASIILQSQS